MENKNRLIDADEKKLIIQALKMHHDSQFTPGVYEHSVFGKAALILESTVDAVEVVRCKDCKKWNVHPINGRLTLGKCLKFSRVMGDTSFCSCGERRTLAEYIDREALLAKVRPYDPNDKYEAVLISDVKKMVLNLVNSVPPADVTPVVHGEWGIYREPECPEWAMRLMCSACGLKTSKKSRYCPNCGRRLEK